MDKKEEDKIKKEIRLLSELLDLNKFNYGRSASNLFSIVVISFTSLAVMISLLGFIKSDLIKIIALEIVIVAFLIFILQIKKDYSGQINSNKLRTDVRRDMIKRRYGMLGTNVNELEEEFKKEFKKRDDK